MLKESEARFQQISEVIEDVFHISELKTNKVLFASPAFEKIWGRPVEDVYEDNGVWDEGIHPDDLKRIQIAWEGMVESGDSYDEEYRVIRPDGSISWVRARTYPISDESKEIYRVAGIVQDITGRKISEEALLKNQVLFHQAEQMGKLGHWEWDHINDRMISCSPEFARIYEMSEDEALEYFSTYEAEYKTVHPNDQERYEQHIDNAEEKQIGCDIEFRILTNRGTLRHIHLQSEFVLDKQGKIIKSFGTEQDITERKLSEEALQKSQALFRQAEALGKMGHWEWDFQDNRMVSCSEQFARIHEMTVDESLKLFSSTEGGFKTIHPEDRERFEQSYRDSIEKLERNEIEYRIVTPSGAIRHIHSVSERVLNDQGELISGTGIVQDITERKQSEAALKESEERFNQLAEAVDEVFVISDMKSMTVLYASPAYEKIWGRPVQELYDDYNLWDEGIHPDDRLRMQEAWARAIEREGLFDEEYRVIHSDASIRWVRGRAYPVDDESGQIYRIAEVISDITQRKQAEDALQESETRFQQISEVIEDVVHISELKTKNVLFVNPAFEKIWGRSVQELYDDSGVWYQAVHPDDVKLVQIAWERMVEREDSYEEEYRLIHSDGSLHWVRDRIYPIRDESGQIYRFAGNVQDITERKLSEKALLKSQALFRQAEVMGKIGHWEWDYQNDRMVYCSEQYARMHEMTVDEALKYFSNSKAILSLIPPEDREGFEQSYRDSIEKREGQDFEHRIVTPSGDIRHVHTLRKRVVNDQGELISGIGIVQDITEYKLSEEALLKSQALFRQAEVMGKIGHWEWDYQNDRMVYCSEQYARMHEMTVDEALKLFSSTGSGYKMIHGDDRDWFEESYRDSIKKREGQDIEYRIMTRSGALRHIHLVSERVLNDQGDLIRGIGIVQDITEHKLSEEALLKSQALFPPKTHPKRAIKLDHHQSIIFYSWYC